MKIYIASSWKNQHAVEMLTRLLRGSGHTVASFVENNFGEGHGAEKPINFEEWVLTQKADQSFKFDIDNAIKSDLVIYISPSGCDAWAEVGAAYGRAVPIIGLSAKGESIGLMRKMMFLWCHSINDLFRAIDAIKELRRR